MTVCPLHTHNGPLALGGAPRVAGRPAYGHAWSGVRPFASSAGIRFDGIYTGKHADARGIGRPRGGNGRDRENHQRGRTGAGSALAHP
jgi:hypothetical protein